MVTTEKTLPATVLSNRQTPPKQPKLSRTHRPENMSLEEWQRQLRVEYGKSQEFHLENRGDHPVFSEFA